MIKKKIIIIEGNIGSGKSTLLDNIIKYNKNFVIFKEPINKWKFYLENFYINMKQNSFKLQNVILQSYIDIYNDIIKNNNTIFILERSHYSAFYIFIYNLYNNNLLNKLEFDILYKKFKEINIEFEQKFNIIYIFLDTNINECLKRIKKRNNKYEKKINLKYLSNIDLNINNMKNFIKFKIVNINGNKTELEIYKNFEDIYIMVSKL